MYSTNFNDFDMNKDFGPWAELRKHYKLRNNATGIRVFTYSRKVTLNDVLKQGKSNEFTVLSVIPWSQLGDKPSPFDDDFYDPSNSILSNQENFNQYYGITKPTTEVSPSGSMLAMHQEEHNAQAINFNYGPGSKLWVVVDSRFTLKAGQILGKLKFKDFYGACDWTFCHRDVVYNLEEANIPFKEIIQHPGDTIYLPPGVLHSVRNISANMSESLNIIMKKDLPLCRSYKVCEKHQGLVQISGREEMNSLFEKFKTNRIENFIHFSDDQRDRKLRAIEQLKNSCDPEKQALLINLKHSYVVSHKVPDILKAFEDGRFMFQDARVGVGSSQNCGADSGRNLTENQHSTQHNAEECGSNSSPYEFARTTAMVHQPDHFESLAEEDENPTNQGVALSSAAERDQAELENEIGTHSLEHPADSEPLTFEEIDAENLDVDNEEEFSIKVVGQNILKSVETQRFKCLCPCRPTIISKKYAECFLHLHRKHQLKVIIPTERCTLCERQNYSVFKNIHTCALPLGAPRPRENKKWRKALTL